MLICSLLCFPHHSPELIFHLIIISFFVSSLDVCVECERERVALLAARASEKSRVLSLDRPFLKAGECWYLLPAEWLHRWHAYVADENGDVPSPGAINNLQVLNNHNEKHENTVHFLCIHNTLMNEIAHSARSGIFNTLYSFSLFFSLHTSC